MDGIDGNESLVKAERVLRDTEEHVLTQRVISTHQVTYYIDDIPLNSTLIGDSSPKVYELSSLPDSVIEQANQDLWRRRLDVASKETKAIFGAITLLAAGGSFLYSGLQALKLEGLGKQEVITAASGLVCAIGAPLCNRVVSRAHDERRAINFISAQLPNPDGEIVETVPTTNLVIEGSE